MPIATKYSAATPLAGVAAVAAMLWLAPGFARAAPEIGKPAPQLVVTELDGQIFDLAKL